MSLSRAWVVYGVTLFSLGVLVAWHPLLTTLHIEETSGLTTAWWWLLLLWGTMLMGFIFQPRVKASFPGLENAAIIAEPARLLKDYETLMGYYPWTALCLALSAFVLATPLFGANETLFTIHNVNFWWAAIASGILNIALFYFFNKALRYGDLSLVTGTQALYPVLSLPVSLFFFSVLGAGVISNPSVSLYGLIGIMFVVGAVAFNALTQRRTTNTIPPTNDWFAAHPLTSALMSVLFAGFAVNLDKVAIDAGNPFLAGVITMGTVALGTLLWSLLQDGPARVAYVFKTYRREFFIVGVLYGLVIIVFNMSLFGHNVNYYGAIKRSSIVFSTLYGLYVLNEGKTGSNQAVRFFVSVAILAGSFLIIWKG